jgi:translation elongation factor EF-Ts
LIGLEVDENNNQVTMIQLSCETDFVAKTDRFKDGLEEILKSIHSHQDIVVLMDKSLDEPTLTTICKSVSSNQNLDPDQVQKQTILEGIKYTVAKTQENC